MPVIEYKVFEKPIEERIIDAACIYWQVERDYFTQKNGGTTVTYRKGIVYYLIKNNTTYSYTYLAELFGFSSHQPVLRLVENLDATVKKIKQHFNDAAQVMLIADKLQADCLRVHVQLINNNLNISPEECPASIHKINILPYAAQ